MKILASDYDGTLSIDGEVSNLNVDALKKWRTAGNAFGVVTGRSTKTLKTKLKEYNIDFDFAVCNNGGVILDSNFEVLQLNLIRFDIALEIMDFLRGKTCKSFTLNDGHRRAMEVLNHEAVLSAHALEGEIDSLDDLIGDGNIAQIVAAFDVQADANALAKEINQTYGDYVEGFANVNCVDIVPKGVSKATGVAYIAKEYGYDLNKVYAIGDSYNDLSMLDAYHGATLVHAVDEMKVNREYIVSAVDEFVDVLLKKG